MTNDVRMLVEPVGRCLLASVGRPSRRATALAHALPEDDSDRIAVVLGDAAADRVPELAERLQPWVPSEWESIRLVAAFAGASASGARPVAQVLADQLGVEVLAPDGQLLVVPGGTLFVLGGRERESHGTWWRFRPGREPERDARRFTAPQWERQLAAMNEPAIPGVVVEEIPAGLWIHGPGPARPDDLAFAIPVSATTLALVVSRAGDPPVRRADVWRLIEALPAELYDRLAVVPYGDRPVEDGRLGAVVSLAANRTLRVQTGMPLLLGGSGSEVTAVGADGEPTWRPFAQEMAWRPHAGARVLRWTPPAENLLPFGPAQMLLTERWLVEVIEAGLWIHEVDRADAAMTIRGLPLDSRHCAVVVGVHDHGAPPPWRTVDRFLRRLPGDAQDRLRLVVPLAASQRVVRAAASACAGLLDAGSVCLLTPRGDFVPWEVPDEPVPRPAVRPDGPPARAARRRGQGRRKSTESADIARLMSFVNELRRLSTVDELGGRPGPVDVDTLPAARPAGRAVPVPDLVVGDGRSHRDKEV